MRSCPTSTHTAPTDRSRRPAHPTHLPRHDHVIRRLAQRSQARCESGQIGLQAARTAWTVPRERPIKRATRRHAMICPPKIIMQYSSRAIPRHAGRRAAAWVERRALRRSPDPVRRARIGDPGSPTDVLGDYRSTRATPSGTRDSRSPSARYSTRSGVRGRRPRCCG